MRINLLIAPYRDAYFYHRYGCAVRDLQFLETLAKFDEVHSITVINRPVSVLERGLFRKFRSRKIETLKITTYDCTSSDLLGAIKGRSWADDVYPEVLDKLLKENKREGMINVFLDFLPIGRFNTKLLDGWVYWYDFIDNFKKHNRYSCKEKELVKDKYTFVSSHADIVTAVSEKCLGATQGYTAKDRFVISNKVFTLDGSNNGCGCSKMGKNVVKFDFGFIGFITDKLDIEFLKNLARQHTIAIFGQSMDQSVEAELKAVKNIKLFGRFKYQDLPRICSMFNVGLLPYLKKKSHDGSPLKLYEYMKYNIPCLTSMDYEISGVSFIVNYNTCKNLDLEIRKLFSIAGNPFISSSIRDDWKLDYSLKKIMLKISSLTVIST